MNKKMFLSVIKQTPNKVDFSSSLEVKPNTIKFVKVDDMFYAYKIDENCNKILICENPNEKKIYQATLKYLNIKFNRFGEVIQKETKKRS